MTDDLVLHGFWRSTASWRVRMALGHKRLAWRDVTRHLRLGEQNVPDYLAINPQGMVPALVVGGQVLTQSMAVCEFLDEVCPEPPLLPKDPIKRAKIGAAAQVNTPGPESQDFEEVASVRT